MLKRTINQFLLTATLLASLHFGSFLTQPELLGTPVSYLPLLIDVALLFVVLSLLIACKLVLSRSSFEVNTFLLEIPGTIVFLTLGISAIAVVVYSAYTGDNLNLSILGYSISHIHELIGPIVAESGYYALVLFAILSAGASALLYKAHLLDTKRLIFTLALFPHTILVLVPFTSSPHPPRLLTYFSPAASPFQAGFELDKEPLPPWYRSFYMTLFGIHHGAFKTLEFASPLKKYGGVTYSGQSGNKPNIVLLVMESIRAEATSPYNDAAPVRNLTPNITELSRSGLLFEHAYTTVPHTSKALVGILCGQFPNREMEIIEAEPGGLAMPCIPELLENAGYKTAFFQSAIGKFENRHGLTQNMRFQEIYSMEQLPQKGFKRLSYVAMDDYVMLEPTVNWMRQHKQQNQPFFVSLLTVVSHHPYTTPLAKTGESEKESPYENYLAAVAYTDRFVGDLIHKMKEAGLMENTIVLITGDHGEAFGDHGPSFHNGTPHEDGMHVPLLIYSPNLLKSAKRINGLRSQLDILPTVLEFSGIKFSGDLPGKSLMSQDGHESLAGACWYEKHCAVGYKANGEKYIYWYGRKPNEYYQLRRDPGESLNLIHSLSMTEERELVRSTFLDLNSYQTVYQNFLRDSHTHRLIAQ